MNTKREATGYTEKDDSWPKPKLIKYLNNAPGGLAFGTLAQHINIVLGKQANSLSRAQNTHQTSSIIFMIIINTHTHSQIHTHNIVCAACIAIS